MLLFYRIIVFLVLILSPIILFGRIIKKKETLKSFFEKIGIYNKHKTRSKRKLIWIHGSSVGEILGVLPLIEKLDQSKYIGQILITSNTLSSSKIINNLNLKKTVHQFFPLDTNFLSKRFLNYWRPDIAIFIESEIWPNIILQIKEKKIPLILLNARITKKSFNRWKSVPYFASFILSKFDLLLAQNNSTKKYLKKLGINKVKKIGNLKFCKTNLHTNKPKNLKNIANYKKIPFCAVSTHHNEEIICGKIHKELKNILKNITTIIIPRHIERVIEIKNDLEKMNLKVQMHNSKKIIEKNTDIYLVNTYGETRRFLDLCNIAFFGGSLVDNKGHNPMEAARLGHKIFYGPHISNHYEAYNLLDKINVSKKINNISAAKNFIIKNINNTKNSKKIKEKLDKISKKILSDNLQEINKYILNVS